MMRPILLTQNQGPIAVSHPLIPAVAEQPAATLEDNSPENSHPVPGYITIRNTPNHPPNNANTRGPVKYIG